MDPLESLISVKDLEKALDRLGASFLSDEQKQQVARKMAGLLLDRVFIRIANVLTKEDFAMFKEVDAKDSTGTAGKYFLYSKISNMPSLVREELDFLLEDLSGAPAETTAEKN